VAIDPDPLVVFAVMQILGNVSHELLSLSSLIRVNCILSERRLGQALTLVERRLHNLRANRASSHIDLDFLSFVCELDRNVRETNVLFQKRCRASGSNFAYWLPIHQHVLIISRNSAFRNLKAHQPAANPTFLLPGKCFATFKLTFIQLANPSKVGLEQGG